MNALFWNLKQGFSGWKRCHFDTVGILKKDMKRILLERGIFVPLKGYPDSVVLEIAISKEEPHDWTDEEISAGLKRNMNYHPRTFLVEKKPTLPSPTKIEDTGYDSRSKISRQPSVGKASRYSAENHTWLQQNFIPSQPI